MPGASQATQRIKILNANWMPDADGSAGDGQFVLQMITEDDERVAVPTTPGAMTAIVTLAQAETVLAWDPENRVLIIANIIGTMPWTVQGDGDGA
jgi:hypothetical protein